MLTSPGFPSVMMLGPAGKALAGGPEAAGGNPAMISSGFTASGGRWNLQTTCVSAAGGFTLTNSTRLAASLVYLGKGGILRRDDTGTVTGEYSYSTGSVMTGLSQPLTSWLRAGISAGLSWENIDTQAGTGIAASAGLAADIGDAGSAALCFTGIGKAPEWNGVTKDMPTEICCGASWRFGDLVETFAGAEVGFSTASSFGGGLKLSLPDLALSAGYRLTPDQDEVTGFFAGLQYTYTSGGTYIIEAAISQRDHLDWPVMAGISIRL